MRDLSRVSNEPHLRKDTMSGAVVNVSTDDYNKYLKRKASVRAENDRIDNLESELVEIKTLLRSALDKLEK